MALVADTCGEDGAVGGDCDGCDLAARRFKEHVAFALWADAIDEAGAVGSRDEVAFRVPRESADVLLVALEEDFGLGVGIGGIDAIDGPGAADGDVEFAGGVKGHIPDVVRFRFANSVSNLRCGSSVDLAIELAGVEDDFCGGLILFCSGAGIELVDFSAGKVAA